MTLTGKRALVTGASRGIGAAIANALAAEGADIAITYEKSTARAAEVVSAIKAKGRRGGAIQVDSANASAVQASVDKAVTELGGLDILGNNAGILRFGELKDSSLADIDALLNINVRAPFTASKAAVAHLGKGGRTDMFPANSLYAEKAKQYMALGRFGAPEDIAHAVAFLANAKAQYITGATLTIDGGANA
jgi:3-oxoacyl-[acyl-carrier protein] reductase